MQTPVEIDFQGMTSTPKIQAAIEAQVARLEERFGRATACRVVLKGPSERRQTGGLYEVNIRLALPDGREVNVARTPDADERHADLAFALNDAFKRARRGLQDHVRRLQNQVKQHDGPPTGTVVRIDPSGEFGFIEVGRRPRALFPSQQRARRPETPGARRARELRGGDGRQGPAGEHRQAARQAQAARLRTCAAPSARTTRISALRPPARGR